MESLVTFIRNIELVVVVLLFGSLPPPPPLAVVVFCYAGGLLPRDQKTTGQAMRGENKKRTWNKDETQRN